MEVYRPRREFYGDLDRFHEGEPRLEARLRRRDSYRSRVYAAEGRTNLGARLSSAERCQEYLRRVVRSRWFRARFGDGPVPTVRRKKGRGAWAQRWRHLITLGDGCMNEVILLHELAHLCTPHHHAGHGRLWRRIFCDLVSRFVHREQGEELKAAFREAGLSV